MTIADVRKEYEAAPNTIKWYVVNGESVSNGEIFYNSDLDGNMEIEEEVIA